MRLWLAAGAVALALVSGTLILAFGQTSSAPPRVVVPTPRPSVESRIQVHVAGEVRLPGLYELPASARVAEAIAAAGGVTPDGDGQALNLAARVQDGQRLTVPRLQPTPVPGARPAGSALATAPPESGRINLNTATEAQLDTLPGVGPVTARRVLDWRERNGPFTSVEQLKDLKLVNAATYAKLKDLVTVE